MSDEIKIQASYKRLQSYGHYSNVEMAATMEFTTTSNDKEATAKALADLRQIVDAQVEAELDRLDPHGYWPWKRQGQPTTRECTENCADCDEAGCIDRVACHVPPEDDDDEETEEPRGPEEQTAPECYRKPETCTSPDDLPKKCSFWNECRNEGGRRSCFNDGTAPISPYGRERSDDCILCEEFSACLKAHEARVADQGQRS